MHNFVFGRAGGLAQLNNPNWPQFVSTFTPSKADEFIHHAHLEHIPAWLNRGDSQVSLDRRVWRH
jgi:hypothetical protein